MSRDRDDIPALPEYDIPQTGWHTAEFYAAVFGISTRNMNDCLNRNNIPRRQVASGIVLVRAEDLYEWLPEVGGDAKEGAAKRKR